jgi:hypothetical protein
VGRVHHDDVGGRDGVHHARGGGLHLQPPLGRLDLLGRSLGLRLVLDLLLLHPVLLGEVVLLVGEVEHRDDDVGGRRAHGDLEDRPGGRGEQLARRHAHQGGELVELREDREGGDRPHDGDLEDVLARLEDGAHAEEVLRPRDGVEPLRVGLERRGRGLEADLRDADRQAGDRAGEGDRADREGGRGRDGGEDLPHPLALDDVGRGDEHEDPAGGVEHALPHRRAHERERHQAGGEDGRAVEVRRPRDLALLARLLELLGCGLLRLVRAARHRVRPP